MAGCNGYKRPIWLCWRWQWSGWFGLTEERYVCAKMSVRAGQGRAGRVKIWSTKGEELQRAASHECKQSRRERRRPCRCRDGEDRERTSTNNNTLTSRKQRRVRERERVCKVQECERKTRDMRVVVQGSGRVVVSSSSQASSRAHQPFCGYANSSGNDAIDSTPPRSPNKWFPNKGPCTWSSTITLSSVGICIWDLVVVVR